MGTRKTDILITNNTSITLYRHLHSLVHGQWLSFPPECIEPRGTVQCICQSTSGYGGFHGKLQYNFVIADVEYIICAVFQIPVAGEHVHNVMIGREKDDTDLPTPSEIVSIHWRKASSIDGQFEIVIKETTKGAQYFQECKDELRKSWNTLNQELSSYGFSCFDRPPPTIMKKVATRAPFHFVWNVRNVGWLPRLREAHRSLYIRLVNLTGEKLVLVWQSSLRNLPLEEGQWVEFPRETIEPGSCSECGFQCEGFFGGSKGRFKYAIANSQEQRTLMVSWDQRVQLFRVSVQKEKCGQFSFVKHEESHNQASVHIHILDSSNLPKLELLSARAISPRTLQFLSTEQQTLRTITRDTLFSLPSTLVTPQLIRFLRQAGSGKEVEPPNSCLGSESRYACTEFTLASPRTFFCSYPFTSSGIVPVAPHSIMLLEWQIGCEVFYNVWKTDQTVWLYTAIVGGIDEQSVIMSAQKTENNYLPPLDLLGMVLPDEILTTFSSEREVFGKYYNPLSRDDLLNGLVHGMQILALGLQGLAEPLMRAKFGTDWFQHECQVPKDHLWKDILQSDVNFDLEGIMFVLVSRWDEVFEPIFEEAGFSYGDISGFQKGIGQSTNATKIRQLCHSLFNRSPSFSIIQKSDSTEGSQILPATQKVSIGTSEQIHQASISDSTSSFEDLGLSCDASIKEH